MCKRTDTEKPSVIEPDAFFLHLNLAANAHGFETLSEALIYSRTHHRATRLGSFRPLTYKAVRKVLFAMEKIVYLSDGQFAYAYARNSRRTAGLFSRISDLRKFLPSTCVGTFDAFDSRLPKDVALVHHHLGICPFSMYWKLMYLRVPLRDLASLHQDVLRMDPDQTEWYNAVDLLDLQFELRHFDSRKDRVGNIPIRSFRNNNVLRLLLPHIASSMPKAELGWTFVWEADRWVRNGEVFAVKLLAFQRRRLARLLAAVGLREALYRAPGGYNYRYRAKSWAKAIMGSHFVHNK